MKANEAPEKIYLFENPISGYPDDRWLGSRSGEDDVEYTTTDAFIEKAWDWIEDNIMSTNQRDESLVYFEQFRNYMKGE